jgi:hypothetical protein
MRVQAGSRPWPEAEHLTGHRLSQQGRLTEPATDAEPRRRRTTLRDPFPPFRRNCIRHHGLPEPVAALDRKPPVAVWGSVFLRRVGSDHGPKNLEKTLDGTARAEGLRGDAGAFAQEVQLVSQQFGIA